jgi:hypothetical protein
MDPARWGLELSRYLHLSPVRVSRQGLDNATCQQDRAGTGARPEPDRAMAHESYGTREGGKMGA